MRERRLNLDGYGISCEMYRELRSFALQYGIKKKKLTEEITPELRAKLTQDCADIEQAARDCTDGNAHIEPCIIKMATDRNYKFYISKELGETPCAENTFSKCRRRFYYLPAVRRGMI